MQIQIDVNKSNLHRDEWFENLAASLRADKLMLDTNTADVQKVELYDNLISGDPTALLSKIRNEAKQFFVAKALRQYFIELKNRIGSQHSGVLTIACSYSDSEILIWAVTEDDDEEACKHIILAAATVNVEYYKHGYSVRTMVLEQSDKVSIPNHYQVIWP